LQVFVVFFNCLAATARNEARLAGQGFREIATMLAFQYAQSDVSSVRG
jgi:hypothetical protein